MQRFFVYFWLGIALLLPGCQLAGSNGLVEDQVRYWRRTYPPALDLPELTLPEVMQVDVDNTEINVRGFVASVVQCPPKSACIVPDLFLLSDSFPIDPETSVWIIVTAHTPKQLRVSSRRLFSIHVRVIQRDETTRRYSLLGYD